MAENNKFTAQSTELSTLAPNRLSEAPESARATVKLPLEADFLNRTISFVEVERSEIARAMPLDSRTLGLEGVQIPFDFLHEPLAAQGELPPITRYIFYTPFSMSTLLCRLLENFERCLVLKEPAVLQGLSTSLYRQGGITPSPQGLGDIDLSLSVLANAAGENEIPVVKASNRCVNLLPAIMGHRLTHSVLFLFSDQEYFICQALKKPERIEALEGELARYFGSQTPYDASGAKAAAFYWSLHAETYLDCKMADASLLAALNARMLIEAPYDSLKLVSERFGLNLTSDEIRRAVDKSLHQYSRDPSQPFDPSLPSVEFLKLQRQHQWEIEDAIAWCDKNFWAPRRKTPLFK
ncbi:MAG TPA: hypothetical protein VFV50_11260 [Bdellovibrionales bacterium]|nr:hypothetical protein [Bdellovibrionales bacterium]